MRRLWRVSLLLAFFPHLFSSNFSVAASPAFNESFTARIRLDSSSLNLTAFEGLNSSNICNYTVPPPMAELWNQTHWDCRIPPFRNFLNESSELDKLSDEEVFEFTPENIASSNIKTWYMAWSRERLNNRSWNASEWAEVSLFARDFLPAGGRDFACFISMTRCMHMPTVSDILRRYPGRENRALAQRIYLLLHMLDTTHQEKLHLLNALTQAAIWLPGKAYAIIKTFTKQVDAGAVMGCEIIKKVIDLAIQIGLSMANGAASAVSNALTAKGSLFEELASINVLDGKTFSNMGFGMKEVVNKDTGEVVKQFGKMMRDDWSDAAKFNWFGTLQQQFWSVSEDALKKGFAKSVQVPSSKGDGSMEERMHLDAGVASDTMCSSFEGDRQDLNEANTHALEDIIAEWFSTIRAQTLATYEKLYNGFIPREGIRMPSMLALQLAMSDWPPLNGPNSLNHPLKDTAKFEKHVKLQALKRILSFTMSDDGIYLYCMHTDKAQEECSHDTFAKGTRGWWKDYRKTQICPRPKEDSTLLCSAARWYHTSTFNSHVGLMPGINLIEGFSKNDWNLKPKELLQEAYETYVLYRNNASATDENWKNGRLDTPMFALPTCVSDHLRLHDGNPLHGSYLTHNVSHLQFPSFCGNWRANETKGFMKMLNLDPKSELYGAVEGPPGFKHPNELFWDRIPRLLAEMYLTPVSHYLALCGAGVRLPEEKDRDRSKNSWVINFSKPTNEVDKDCDLVGNAVRNMTELEANEWFCDLDGRSHHTVFQRQFASYTLPQTWWIRSASHKKCHAWIKQQGNGKWGEYKETKEFIDAYEKAELKEKKEEEQFLKQVYAQEERDQIAEDKRFRKLIEDVKEEEEKRRKEEDQVIKKMGQEIENSWKEEQKLVAKLLKEMEDEENKQRKEEAAALKSMEVNAEKAHREDEKRRKKEAKKGGN
ncbi:hypothetical protein BDZ45DRAFT_765053 [Acephala macrosclerotiorum]|nr:hypothetical protein BDZ45DRAFT_765053 [Acephala macrosclerotiorum]